MHMSTRKATYNMISKLTKSGYKWMIKVRVTRLWDAVNISNGSFLGLEMVMVDENNEHITAQVGPSLCDKFRMVLKERSVYLIKNFAVSSAPSYMMTVFHSLKIFYTPYTEATLVNVDCPEIPKHSFQFVDFRDTPGRYPKNIVCTDVIHRLHQIDQSRDQSLRNGGSSKFQTIWLTNESGSRIEVVLWGDLVDMARDMLPTDTNVPTIVAVTSTYVKYFKALKKYSLSTTCATKLYVNLDVPEIAALINPLIATSCSVQHVQGSSTVMTYPRWITLEKLDEFRQHGSSDERNFRVYATILGMNTQYPMWYLACQLCMRKVVAMGPKYYCESCKSEIRSPAIRYKLEVMVHDRTGGGMFVLFDKVATQLVGCDAPALSQDESNVQLHRIVNKLSGLHLMWDIQVTEYNFANKFSGFTVKRVTEIDFASKCSRLLRSIRKLQIDTSTSQLGKRVVRNEHESGESSKKRFATEDHPISDLQQ